MEKTKNGINVVESLLKDAVFYAEHGFKSEAKLIGEMALDKSIKIPIGFDALNQIEKLVKYSIEINDINFAKQYFYLGFKTILEKGNTEGDDNVKRFLNLKWSIMRELNLEDN